MLRSSPLPGDWDFCGLPVDSPLGVPAGPLLNGDWCLYYASLGFDVNGRLLALNSYENRVYQVGIGDRDNCVVKFYRPERWTEQHPSGRSFVGANTPEELERAEQLAADP